MKVITLLGMVLLLQGCVDARGIALQEQYCSDKGGVYEYVQDIGGLSLGWCKDNTKFTYDTVRGLTLRPEFYPTKD